MANALPPFTYNKPESDEDWSAVYYEAQTLFTPAAPIRMADFFSGRRTQINDVLEATAEPGRHVVLYGERGVGKSSLAECISTLFPKTNRNIFSFRVQCDSTDNFTTLWRKVFDEIRVKGENESDEFMAQLDLIYSGELAPNDIRRALQYSFGSNSAPIVIIDEFNELIDRGARQDVASVVKHLSDYGISTTVIIIGVADDVTGLIEGYRSIERAVTQIHMPRMNITELEEVVETRIQRLGLSISEEALWKIVNLSRGLPAYAHNLGLYSVRSACAARHTEIVTSDVDLSIEKVVKRVEQSNGASYAVAVHSNHSNNIYRQVLLACALAPPDEEGYFRPNDVCEPLSMILKKEVSTSTFQRHLPEFTEEARGCVLTRRGSSRRYKYRFTEPIMQPLVIMKGLKQGFIKPNLHSILKYQAQKTFGI